MPTPLSPSMSTGVRAAATISIVRSTFCRASERVRMSEAIPRWTWKRRRRFSRSRKVFSPAFSTRIPSSSKFGGLVR
ncbi:MAG: hypothetical protein DMF79_12945 [Acidobacteria bacterium]|nr:MAG: hypothetical protein DMF79_12945 [Acidobacteriota bacterium]